MMVTNYKRKPRAPKTYTPEELADTWALMVSAAQLGNYVSANSARAKAAILWADSGLVWGGRRTNDSGYWSPTEKT